MERSPQKSEEIKDNSIIDSLKQRMSEIPLVHKAGGSGSENE